MSDFYIVPPRLIVGSLQRSNVVTSLNTLRGDLSFKVSPDTGLVLNINSGVFNLSIQPDFYIKKSGDIVPSNIIFQPDPGKYGLAVGSGLTDPSTGVGGALYFNTTYNVLKVYDGSTWNEIASTGTSGITQSFADSRYLRLDGGNVPTASISMGSQFLRLANLTTRVSAGTAGQVYYNTDTNKLDLYNGSAWVPVGSGITQLNAGNGITLSNNPITTFGTVSVDQSYNFNWTGAHTYTQPITFAASQMFDASKLTIAYEVQGDILHFNGTNWARLPLGTPNQVLSVSNCGGDVEWHSLAAGPGIAISYNAGTLTFSSLSASGISGIAYLNNLTSTTQYFATGTSGVGFNISSSGSTHTFNIPIAGVGVTGLITGIAQTIDGSKTFLSDTIISSNSPSTSISNGALVITGGVGIGGSLFSSSSYASSISGVVLNNGVITSGSWAGNLITAFYGGTGFNSYNKGDLLVGVGSTFVKLPAGSNNYVLAADSTTDSGLKWIVNSGGGGGTGASVYIGETPPPWTPNAGDFWWNSGNGALNIYYADIDTSQWVEINSYFGGIDAPANFGIGITQINNVASSSQFLYAGFSGNTFNISSTGNSHTFNIPIAGVGSTGLVSGIAQTFGGVKTFQNGLISGNGVTIYGSLTLPNQPLSSVYGGTGLTIYNLGDLLVGAGNTLISLPQGSNGYVLQSNNAFPSGLGWTYVSNVNVSETAPTPATTGDLWWNSVDGSLSVYFVDIDSTAQWVEVGNAPSSGSGTSTISGIYYLNGLYDSTQYLNVGAGSSYYVESISNTHTIQIPLAGSGFTGLMSGIAQTFSGNKTFQNDVLVSGMLNFTFATIGTAGITTSPSIAFIGQTNNPITLSVLPDNSLSFDSTSGQLFKISNDLFANYIYSVNDVSGLPIIRAKSDSTLTMAEYGSNVGIGLSNPSYKLQVVGDVYSTTSKASKGFVETVFGFGTTSGSITPNWDNGSTQTMTLNNNLTLNAPASMPTGASMKLVITQDVSGSRLLSPNGAYKFLGGVNTLSTAGNAIDIISIFYDGANYLSEIKKGYS